MGIALLSFAFDVAAQGTDGEIQGVVTETSGAVLPGVTVTIVSMETAASHTLRTDASGRFTGLTVKPGPSSSSVAVGETGTTPAQAPWGVGRPTARVR